MSSLSSSSSSSYDVFLNFRREDTGDNFTSHLHHALRRNKIKSFTYDDLNKGHDIMASLFEAIEGSRISIIIFSKNYASSESCLDELVKIIECKKVKGQIVIPIFYHVRPSDVRCQTGSFEDAFVNHEQHSKRAKEKLERWRGALMEASDLCGWDSSMIRPESKLVEEIVGDILNKLNAASPSSNFRGRIQTNSSIDQQMDSTVSIGWGRSIRRRGGALAHLKILKKEKYENVFTLRANVSVNEKYEIGFVHRQFDEKGRQYTWALKASVQRLDTDRVGLLLQFGPTDIFICEQLSFAGHLYFKGNF